MDLLFEYKLEKKNNRVGLNNQCNISIYSNDKELHMINKFIFDQAQLPKGLHGKRGTMNIEHVLSLNLKNGDFTTYFNVVFLNEKNEVTNTEKVKTIKNNFRKLLELTENGYYYGEKTTYPGWGVKYQEKMVCGFNIMKKLLTSKFKSEYLINKPYYHSVVNPFYDLIVDFHLDMKEIKPHDFVYLDILKNYPIKKYLKTNDMKFLPSVLEQHNIKSSHIITTLNETKYFEDRETVDLKTLKYLCNLFGNDHVEYLKKINWIGHCSYTLPNNKLHNLKTKQEKKTLLSLMVNINENFHTKQDGILISIFHILELREYLEKMDLNLKFDAKTVEDFKLLKQEWVSLKKQYKRGYKISYVFPDGFIDVIEEDIIVDAERFKVKILKTEDDFIFEGKLMKNCMGKQFSHGSAFIYIVMTCDGKRVDLQYGNGKLSMSYGKANSEVLEIFKPAIEELSKKIKKHSEIKWIKEKISLQ